MRTAPLLLALAALAPACGGPASPDPAEAGRDLLAVAPSERLETLGHLQPGEDGHWEAWRGRGWREVTEGSPTATARSKAAEAVLTLPAAAPADRVLELWAALPGAPPWTDPTAERPVWELVLNGIELGAVELGPSSPGDATDPARAVEAPRAAWLAGDNELVLRVDPAWLERLPDGELAGPVLRRLTYGAPRRVTGEAGTPVLADGTGLRWLLEERGAAEVAVAARADGPGTLTLRARRLGRGGTSLGDPLERALPTTGGAPLAGTWTLPAAEGGLVELELSWAGDGPLALTGLDLREALERPSPPIVLISIDTLGARHMSLYGYPRATTPHLDAAAADMVVFERAHTNAPWTMPSYAALFTGQYPAAARSSPHLSGKQFASTLPERRWTLAEALRAAGYRTGAFVDSPNVRGRLGFDQGFEVFDESALAVPHGEPGGGLTAAADAALAWLDDVRAADPAAPWLLFLHANDVHGPYLPEASERGRFLDDGHDDRGPELWAGAVSGVFGQVPSYLLPSALEDHDPDAARLPAAPFARAYDESIRGLDGLLAGFLDDLEARGVLDEAVVVLTADHGEAFGQHDHLGHGLLYDEVLHVPLLVRLPPSLRPSHDTDGADDAGTGRVVTPVQLVDLYPTLAELAGLATDRPELHGRSLVPLLRGETLPEVPTYAEGGLMRQASVTLDGWKLIELWPAEGSVPWTMLTNPRVPEAWLRERAPASLEGPMTQARMERIAAEAGDLAGLLTDLQQLLGERRLELYDLGADPGEANDLFAERPDVVARLLPHLEAAKARLEETRAADAEDAVRLSDEDLAELEALGY